MTQNKTYIYDYCTIESNEIVLNGASIFKIEPTTFADFSKQAYRNFDINYPKFFKMDSLSKLAFLGAELLLKSETELNLSDTELTKQTENNHTGQGTYLCPDYCERETHGNFNKAIHRSYRMGR